MKSKGQVSAPPRKSSRRKRLLFRFIIVAVTWLFIELTAYAGFWLIEGEPFSYSRMQESRSRVRARVSVTDRIVRRAEDERKVEVTTTIESWNLHPYLGFVHSADGEFPFPYSALGFQDDKSAVQKREPGKFIVGIIGGSVAQGFYQKGTRRLTELLKASPRYADKEFVFLNLGLGGYKQPQQLMTVNYLLALGGEFDMVINFDGFNEVALDAGENARMQVAAIYPRNWYHRVANLGDSGFKRAIGLAAWSEARRTAWTDTYSKIPLHNYSVALNLIWRLRDASLHQAQTRAQEALLDYQPRDLQSDLITGPGRPYENEDEAYQDLTDIWMRCSIQLQRLCEANGIEYYHFLQPNQYVPGTKKLHPAELKTAYDETHRYVPGVRKGYPLLIEKGKELTDAGAPFKDLTMVFAEVEERIYGDTCCHMGPLGHEIIADSMAQFILNAGPRKAKTEDQPGH